MSERGGSTGGRRPGRGRGRRPGADSDTGSATSSPSSATPPGKGIGRGRGHRIPKSPGDADESVGAVAAAAASMETLAVQESADVVPKHPDFGQEEATDELKQAMKRPGIGNEGRKIALQANHFPLRIPQGMTVQHYDFAIARLFKRKKGTVQRRPWRQARRVGADDEEPVMTEEVLREEGEYEIVLCRRNTWPKWLCKAVFLQLKTNTEFGLVPYEYKMVFDGAKNVFAKCGLPVPTGDGYRMEIKLPGEERTDTFIVTLNRVAEVNIDLREVFNRNLIERRSISTLILDLIMRQSKMFSNVFISIGPRAFYHPEYPASLGGGLWHYPGIWSSARPVSGWKSTVNLDLANTAFVKSGPLLNFLAEIAPNWQRGPLRPFELKALEKLVFGLKVDLMQRSVKRSGRCVGVTRMNAEELKFQCPVQGGGTAPITIAKYFREKYAKGDFVRPLNYPHLPCLHVGNKQKQNYVPLEFCEIQSGQRFNGKLSDQQTSAMLKVASQSAPDRRDRIVEEAKHFSIHNDPYMKEFGLSVDTKMVTLTGRVLTPPAIEYHSRGQGSKTVSVSVHNGGWDMKNVRVIRGATIRQWAIINTDERTSGRQIEEFCNRLFSEARAIGMTVVTEYPAGYIEEGQAGRIEEHLKAFKEKATDLDLVLVVLARKNSEYYASTKAAGDTILGVNTQCVLGKNVSRPNGSLLVNLLIKINAKLGGVNNKLVDGSKEKLSKLYTIDPTTKQKIMEPILLIGADVNHPSPTDNLGSPSVAAVVANMDILPAQYAAKIMVQARRQEPIAKLQQAVKEMIYNFYKRNKVVPTRIIMYRDGVGESMFLHVLTYELYAIREACQAMGTYFKIDNYEPPITFIIVQKRHHTRLFCVNQKDETGKGRNIPPGTTVDTTIVHPEEFDFYLCSHLGLQGTSRPTHYHVLWDDSDFSADELQMLTYYLCHTYIRAMKSVSIPPPCYYADLVAYRARQYLTWKQSGSETASSGSSGSVISLAELQQFVSVKDNISERGMYFV